MKQTFGLFAVLQQSEDGRNRYELKDLRLYDTEHLQRGEDPAEAAALPDASDSMEGAALTEDPEPTAALPDASDWMEEATLTEDPEEAEALPGASDSMEGAALTEDPEEAEALPESWDWMEEVPGEEVCRFLRLRIELMAIGRGFSYEAFAANTRTRSGKPFALFNGWELFLCACELAELYRR